MKNIFKKVLTMALALVMCFSVTSLFACGDVENGGGNGNGNGGGNSNGSGGGGTGGGSSVTLNAGEVKKLQPGQSANNVDYVAVINTDVVSKYEWYCPDCNCVAPDEPDFYMMKGWMWCANHGTTCSNHGQCGEYNPYYAQYGGYGFMTMTRRSIGQQSTGTLNTFSGTTSNRVSLKGNGNNSSFVKAINEEKDTVVTEMPNAGESCPYVKQSTTMTISTYIDETYVYWLENATTRVWIADSLKSHPNITTVAQGVLDCWDEASELLLNTFAPDPTSFPYFKDNYGKAMICVTANPNMSFTAMYFSGGTDKSGEKKINPMFVQVSDYLPSAKEYDNDYVLVHEGTHMLFHMYCTKENGTTDEGTTAFNEGLAALSMAAKSAYSAKSWVKFIDEDYVLQLREPYYLISGSTDSVRNGAKVLDPSPKMIVGNKNGGDPIVDADSDLKYGFSAAFNYYLLAQFAKTNKPLDKLGDFYHLLYATNFDGVTFESAMTAFIKKLNINGISNFKDAVENFYVAMMVRNNSGLYGLYGEDWLSSVSKKYPLYKGDLGDKFNLEERAGVVFQAKNNSFTAPADGGSSVVYYVFKKSSSNYGVSVVVEDKTKNYNVYNEAKVEIAFSTENGYEAFLNEEEIA